MYDYLYVLGRSALRGAWVMARVMDGLALFFSVPVALAVWGPFRDPLDLAILLSLWLTFASSLPWSRLSTPPGVISLSVAAARAVWAPVQAEVEELRAERRVHENKGGRGLAGGLTEGDDA